MLLSNFPWEHFSALTCPHLLQLVTGRRTVSLSSEHLLCNCTPSSTSPLGTVATQAALKMHSWDLRGLRHGWESLPCTHCYGYASKVNGAREYSQLAWSSRHVC